MKLLKPLMRIWSCSDVIVEFASPLRFLTELCNPVNSGSRQWLESWQGEVDSAVRHLSSVSHESDLD